MKQTLWFVPAGVDVFFWRKDFGLYGMRGLEVFRVYDLELWGPNYGIWES